MTSSPTGLWKVLRYRTFRALWISLLISMIGYWMQSLGTAWLMTSLDHSPFMVGVVYAAQMIPSIILAPFAGVLADMFEHRTFLIVVMAWQTGVTVVLALLTAFGLVTPWLLVLFIFLVGIGSACQNPAVMALMQEAVPRDDMMAAITLNSIAVNVSRAVGPAMAGLLVGVTGEAGTFFVNSMCYATFLVIVARFIERKLKHHGANEGFGSALRGGLQYVRRAARFRAVLIRTLSYFLLASANVALLPVMVRQEFNAGPDRLGEYLGLIGIGAIITAFLIAPYANARFTRDQILFSSSMILAACLIGIGWVRDTFWFGATLVLYGGVWMISMVILQVAAQMVLPAWVRGRGLALFSMAVAAGIAGGGMLWGFVASHTSLSITFTAAAIGLTTATLLTARYRISGNEPEEV